MLNSFRLVAIRSQPPSNPRLSMSRDVATHACSSKKLVWIRTSQKDVVTASLESGLSSTFLVGTDCAAPQTDWEQWKKLGQLDILIQQPDGTLVDDTGARVGSVHRLTSAADLSLAERAATSPGYMVADATDWQIIPAENLVAAFQSKPGTLLAIADTAASSRVMLEALEIGTDGVVLCTETPREVRALAKYIQERDNQGKGCLDYETVCVTAVKAVGMGDRACVDLAESMVPGEGLLVGSFARGLFLVHSECGESAYINSRPFRVNAGPVHAYLQAAGGKTRYLSELKSGDEVLVVDAAGRQRTALVGRVKIERRPLILIEAQGADGSTHSILLQNAETVKLVGPSTNNNKGDNSGRDNSSKDSSTWRSLAVSEIKQGDEVFVLVQSGARHTGVAIEESIIER